MQSKFTIPRWHDKTDRIHVLNATSIAVWEVERREVGTKQASRVPSLICFGDNPRQVKKMAIPKDIFLV